MLHIQKFLREGGTIEALALAPYSITAKPHPKYPNLFLFKYNQIDSDFSNPIVKEARGIILDSANDWKVVCFSFEKFFNQSEPLADKIDWYNCRIQEKLDGSLCQVFFYDNQWHVATSGTPDASGEVNGYDISFADLFWNAYDCQGLSRRLSPAFCYVFELTSPENRVVVRHNTRTVRLIGVRDVNTLEECPIDGFDMWFPVVREFNFSSLEALKEVLKDMNGIDQEGFVVVGNRAKPNGSYPRVKIKCDSYVRYHHLRDSLSSTPKYLVDIIRRGESVEFLNYFEEYREQHDKLKHKYDHLTEWHDMFFIAFKEQANGDRKAFAQLAKQALIPSYYFARLDGKTKNVKDFLSTIPLDFLMQLLDKV